MFRLVPSMEGALKRTRQ